MSGRDRPWYCTDCGVRLNPEHGYCWNCGAPRWAPPPPEAPGDAPPAASSRPIPARQERAAPAGAGDGLAGVRVFVATGGVLCLVGIAYFAPFILSPAGRAALTGTQSQFGSPAADPQSNIQAVAVIIVLLLVAAALHAVAYYGLRSYRVGGWVAGLLVAGLWSTILIGVPALVVLLRRSTRERFGLA